MKTKFIALSGLLLSMCIVATAFAQSLRCNGNLVSRGDPSYSVLQKCGEPVRKESICKPVVSQVESLGNRPVIIDVHNCETVEEWTYDQGPNQLTTKVELQRGMVTAITNGGRGR